MWGLPERRIPNRISRPAGPRRSYRSQGRKPTLPLRRASSSPGSPRRRDSLTPVIAYCPLFFLCDAPVCPSGRRRYPAPPPREVMLLRFPSICDPWHGPVWPPAQGPPRFQCRLPALAWHLRTRLRSPTPVQITRVAPPLHCICHSSMRSTSTSTCHRSGSLLSYTQRAARCPHRLLGRNRVRHIM